MQVGVYRKVSPSRDHKVSSFAPTNFSNSKHPKPPHLDVIIQGLRFIYVKDVGKERYLEGLKTRRRKWCKCTRIKNRTNYPTIFEDDLVV